MNLKNQSVKIKKIVTTKKRKEKIMEKIFEELIQLSNKIEKEQRDYEHNKKEETFIDDETKDEDELINEAENMLDRKLQTKQRIDLIKKMRNEFEIKLEEILNLFKTETQSFEKVDLKTTIEINRLIEKNYLI